MLALKKHGKEIGVCFFDVTTLEIFVGQFEDDELFTALRTLTCQIRPVEVVHERELTNSEVLKMLRHQGSNPVMTPMPPAKCFSFVKTVSCCEEYFGHDV